MRILSVAQMREVERRAGAAGLSEAVLQARAGAAVARHVARVCPHGTIVVLAGRGNNGRDAWVAARELLKLGRRIALYALPDGAIHPAELAQCAALGAAVALHEADSNLAQLRQWLVIGTAAIDGLLGIGVQGSPRPAMASIIAALNEARDARGAALRVLAIDVPSGIDAETGAIAGTAVRADTTVVLGAVKLGLLRFPAAGHVGVLVGDDLGLPDSAFPQPCPATLDAPLAEAAVPPRPPNGHKGSFGHALICAGSSTYIGAALLAASAAARAGAGLTTVAASAPLQAIIAARLPEATFLLLRDGPPDLAGASAAKAVAGLLPNVRSLLVGPGLGRSAQASAFVTTVLQVRRAQAATLPLVLDADALFILAQAPELWPLLDERVVLTPHAGEMARLTGLGIDRITAEPWLHAQRLATHRQAVVVLKGSHTVIATPAGQTWTWPHPNAALGTGGTGDVLAGLLAGLLAQGAAPVAAAQCAVYTHAAAAHAVLIEGERDLLLAGDLVARLPTILAALRAARGDAPPADWVPWSWRV